MSMSYITKNILKSINPPHKISSKEYHHSVSPNMHPIYNPQKPIKNNLFPKSRISQNNTNNNNKIQINIIHPKKEIKEKNKIIEGDLNFHELNNNKPLKISPNNFIHQNNHNTGGINRINNRQKRMPRKSPIPLQRSFIPQNLLNLNRLLGPNSKLYYNNNSNNNLIRPNTKSFNRPKNIFQPHNINNNNNYNNTSKSFNSYNLKNNDRSHSPILRSGQNKAINLGMKPKRPVSKSPILGQRSNLGRKNFGFAFINNKNSGINNMQKNVYKKLGPQGNKKININSGLNNKKNRVISGEMFQEESKIDKKINNINNNMRPVSHYINNNNNFSKNIFNENYNENININVLKNNKNDNNSNIINNNKNILRPISKNIRQNNNININKISNNKENIQDNNKNNEKDNIKNINIDLSDNNNKDNNLIKSSDLKKPITDIIPKKEDKKNNTRSQSQGPIDILKRSEENKEKSQKIQKLEKVEQKPQNIVIKKIKEILPYSHVGFDGEQPKENNQDNYFIFKNFADNKDFIYMSVCDGHGIEGHFVSEFIKEVLPYYMSENLKDKNILKDTDKIHQIISDVFIMVNNLLVDNENINSLFSGSTCVSVIYTPERLIVPNIGDSRAVLGRYDKLTKKIKAIDLSRDHKPTEKDEAKRILENDGRIQPFTEEGEFVGPERVWIKEEEVPGLAMTRSFGDRVAATVGVMSEPEIKEFLFDEGDKFMIIASDGIWEFISSQECVEIIDKFYEKGDLKGCCEFLYEESSKRWLKEEEVIDDTTLILVFFE